jgi:hypothetical protein
VAISITRRNPRTGRIERPWRNRDGVFVLGDPAHGAQKHHDRFALKVATIEEVAALVRRGFSVRMTDGDSPPSLISPDSLTLEEKEEDGAAPLWAETLPKPPFGKDAMLAELKRAMLVQANQIAHAGRPDFAAFFIGFESENASYPYCGDDPKKVDLQRFYATAYLDQAYDYAFQVGRYWRFSDDTAQNLNEMVQGANPQASDGSGSPLVNPDSLCRHAADMACGRWKLEQGFALTVRELALLASMKEAAVRNSLSKEHISIEKGGVDHENALGWLKARRDFIPTRVEEGNNERWQTYARFLLDGQDFANAFAEILRQSSMSVGELAEKAKVALAFVVAIASGQPQPDLDALVRVAEALDLDPPHFAGAAVAAALGRMTETARNEKGG